MNRIIESNLLIDFITNPGKRIYRHLLLMLLFGILLLSNISVSHDTKAVELVFISSLELEKNTMQSELELLKNQITPHFLLNTLNNANVLINTEPEKASDVVMTLSDLLRYQLYESTRENVLLSSDIRFLKDFLDLEKIRRNQFEYVITVNGNSNILKRKNALSGATVGLCDCRQQFRVYAGGFPLDDERPCRRHRAGCPYDVTVPAQPARRPDCYRSHPCRSFRRSRSCTCWACWALQAIERACPAIWERVSGQKMSVPLRGKPS
jgi:hypothetical protein